jgi:hypothetical protein
MAAAARSAVIRAAADGCNGRRTAPSATFVLLVIAGVVLVLAAAAGAFLLLRGNSSANAQSGLPLARQGGGPANSAAFQQFRQCMQNNGRHFQRRTAFRPHRPDRPEGKAGVCAVRAAVPVPRKRLRSSRKRHDHAGDLAACSFQVETSAEFLPPSGRP